MKFLIPVIGLLFFHLTALTAQYVTVKYDAAQNWFNQGQPLPAETDMVFTGQVPKDVSLIEVSFLDAKRGDLLHTATWKQSGNASDFSLPVNYKLRSDFNYDVAVNYYGKITEQERRALREQLLATLNTYLDVNLKEANTIALKESPKKMVREMDKLIADYLADYREITGDWNTELTQLVELKLKHMEQAKLNRKFSKQDTTQTKAEVRRVALNDELSEFRQVLTTELDRILNRSLLRIRSGQRVVDYSTVDKPNVLSLNLGYGAVYLSGKLTDGQYGTAPYAGIALPLGNRVLGTKFFRNAAFNMGIFFNTLESGNGGKVEGFLIDQPLYVGLDYKLLQFVHLNVGGTLLDGNTLENGASGSGRQLAVRPFIGLSARVNLQLSLGR